MALCNKMRLEAKLLRPPFFPYFFLFYGENLLVLINFSEVMKLFEASDVISVERK